MSACFPPTKHSSASKPSAPLPKPSSFFPVGFINKGNTCYANSILQVLSVLPSLWNKVPSESNYLSPLVKAISLNMVVKKRSTNPVDPSNFLWALKRKISSSTVSPFDFNTQQDVAEILQVVLDEVKGLSVAACDLISNTQRITTSSDTCFCSAMTEETHNIVTLPVLSDIQTSFNKFLSPESLTSENKWFCPSCSKFSESTRETFVINSAQFLIIMLCRFSNQGPTLLKNEDKFNCASSGTTKHLTVPVAGDGEIFVNNTYSLIATINHSGSLNHGHYWAVIKDNNSSKWYCCNDKLVSQVDESYVNNTTSYILFYKKI